MILQLLISCDNPSLESILSIVKRILLFIQIAGPIILIIMASVGIFQMVTNPQKKNGIKSIINKLLAATMIFFIPIIINALMYMLGDTNKFSDCWNNADEQLKYNTEIVEDDNKDRKQVLGKPDEYEKGVKKATKKGNKGSSIVPSTHQEKGAQAFAAAAREELAAWESGEADYRRYKYPFTGPDDTNTGGWCGMFIGYIGGKVGSGAVHWEGDALPAEPTTPLNYHDWYEKNPQAGEIVDNGPGVKPKVGDLVLMWNGAHVEMVEDVRSDGFWCIGGGGSVDHNWHSFESGNDTWFITPNWSNVQDTSNWDNLISTWGGTVEG